ncbi:PXA domain-containing protein [Geopyxis carbonaria]|nr:PXA domain-containing protein [Geopyxis carbonaria]
MVIFLRQVYHQYRLTFIASWFVIILWLNNYATIRIPSIRHIVWAFIAGASLSSLAITIALVFAKVTDSSSGFRQNRAFRFTTPARWNKEVEAIVTKENPRLQCLYSKSSEISDAIDELLQKTLTQFIGSWFINISSNPSFSTQIEQLLRNAVVQVCKRLQLLEVSQVFVGNIVPLLTSHLHDFTSAERVVRGKYLNKSLTESEELDMAIASKYRAGKLHPAAGKSYSDMQHAQHDHLRKIVDKVMPLILPQTEKKSRVIKIILREIIVCAVMYPVMCRLSDPDTWNQFIESLGKCTLQDRKTVRKLRAALDKHASPNAIEHWSHLTGGAPTTQFIRLTPTDDERTFERFIRSIRLCKNLSDARRLRNEITAQLRRDVTMVDSSENWPIYLRRLETGKRLVDQKVIDLTNDPVSSLKRSESESMIPSTKCVESRLESASLREVIEDSTGLSYFMEYMDRQRRLALVQFWVVVSGLRNPLEDDISSSDEEEYAGTALFRTWSASDRNDIAQIHDAYLSIPELEISENSKRLIKEFLKFGNKATQAHYIRARSALLRAQSSVYLEMQKHYFPGFRSSDLFYKYLASDQSGTQSRPSSNRHSIDTGRSPSPAQVQNAPSSLRQDSVMTLVHGVEADTESGVPNTNTDADFSPPNNSYSSGSGFRSNYDIYPRKLTPEKHMVDAMEAALNDIIEGTPQALEATPDPAILVTPLGKRNSPGCWLEPSSERTSPKDGKNNFTALPQGITHSKPHNLASLGLVAAETRDSVFDTELFPEDLATTHGIESLDEYTEIDSVGLSNVAYDDGIHQASPGDLGLAESIVSLAVDIKKLATQEVVIESLYRKAELTNNVVEMRILRKSKSSLQREIRRKELQKQQYMVQESDNSLFGRSAVNIRSTMVGTEGGQEYALYVIEVYRRGSDHLPAAQWAVARRYSEFFQLHQGLKRFDSVKDLEFPRRRVVMKLQRDFLEKRRAALDRYLKSLLLIPEVCRSQEFRAFLSQQKVGHDHELISLDPSDTRQDIISRLYDSIADGMEDVLGNFPMIDQLSQAGTNVVSAATEPQIKNTSIDEVNVIAEAEAELSAFEDKEAEPFVKPICDLFLEVFELNQKSNWLRGRAVVVVLHQLLGGTIERKLKENTAYLLNEKSILSYIRVLSGMSQGEESQGQSISRTPKDKSRTKVEASITLATLLPDLSASVVGRGNAQSASRRLFATCNNRRLNTSILYMVLDELISEVFGVSVK